MRTLWYCIYTEPGKEDLASQELKTKHEIFYPKLQLDDHPPKPLFPRYLFVAVIDEWHHICRTRGVSKILGYPGPPTEVDATVIEDLRTRCDAQSTAHVETKIINKVRHGDFCRVTHGPFKDFEGLCCSTAKDRVTLLLTLFGTRRATIVARSNVALI